MACKKEDAENQNNYYKLIDKKGKPLENTPEWVKPLLGKEEQPYYDWDEYRERTGIDVFSEKIINQEGMDSELVTTFERTDENGEHIKVAMTDVNTINKMVDTVYYNVVFEADYLVGKKADEDHNMGRLGDLIWDLETLEGFRSAYCEMPYKERDYWGKLTGRTINQMVDFKLMVCNRFKEGENFILLC
jgi:hypothetical protein